MSIELGGQTIRKHHSDKEPSEIFTNVLVDSSGITDECQDRGQDGHCGLSL
jgi:hypothetical protein